MKKVSKEEWKEIADLTKRINEDIQRLVIISSKAVNVEKIKSLKRSSKHLNKFRSEAENVMFTKGILDKNIFYKE